MAQTGTMVPLYPAANQPARPAMTITASTPSRDSQLDRHWLSARQARSGWPRWKVELISPAPISASVTTPTPMTACCVISGSNPITIQPARPRPRPDMVVKKMMDQAGRMTISP